MPFYLEMSKNITKQRDIYNETIINETIIYIYMIVKMRKKIYVT